MGCLSIVGIVAVLSIWLPTMPVVIGVGIVAFIYNFYRGWKSKR